MRTSTTYSFSQHVRAPFASIFEPEKFFVHGGNMLDELAAALFVITIRLSLVFAYRPYFVRSILVSLPPEAAKRFAEHGAGFLTTSFYAQIAGSILLLPAQVALMTLLIYIVLVAVGPLVGFRSLLRTTMLASVVLAFRDLFRFLLVALRGIDSIHSVQDFQPPVGLGLLFPDAAPFLRSAIDTVNLFEIWFLTILVIALIQMRGSATSRRDAIVAIGGSWAIWQLARCGLLFFFAQAL